MSKRSSRKHNVLNKVQMISPLFCTRFQPPQSQSQSPAFVAVKNYISHDPSGTAAVLDDSYPALKPDRHSDESAMAATGGGKIRSRRYHIAAKPYAKNKQVNSLADFMT